MICESLEFQDDISREGLVSSFPKGGINLNKSNFDYFQFKRRCYVFEVEDTELALIMRQIPTENYTTLGQSWDRTIVLPL